MRAILTAIGQPAQRLCVFESHAAVLADHRRRPAAALVAPLRCRDGRSPRAIRARRPAVIAAAHRHRPRELRAAADAPTRQLIAIRPRPCRERRWRRSRRRERSRPLLAPHSPAVVIGASRARSGPVAHHAAIRAALERVAQPVAACRRPVVQLRRHRARLSRAAVARFSRSLAQRSTCDDLAASHAHSGPQNSQRVIATGRRYVAAQRRHSRVASPSRYGPGHTPADGHGLLRWYALRLLLR